MSITFSNLVTRLSTAVPAESGSPSAAQYEQAIRDAVSDFNADVTRLKSTTLAIVAGTATYTLPADFVKMVVLKPLVTSSSRTGQVMVVTASGLIPMNGPLTETISIEGDMLRITPTPAYSASRELRYGAGHIETGTAGSTVYAEMSEREARIILMLAQSYAYGYQSAVKVGGVTEYTIGDVRAKMSNAATDLQAAANALLAEYKAAVAKYIGTLIGRG